MCCIEKLSQGDKATSTVMATSQQQKADLVARYKLTQAMLNRKVEDGDISKLKRIIPSFDSIASELLERVDRTRVESDGRNESQRIQKMLETWQDRNGYAATFDKLITAMLEAGEVGQATDVCKLLNPGQLEIDILGVQRQIKPMYTVAFRRHVAIPNPNKETAQT